MSKEVILLPIIALLIYGILQKEYVTNAKRLLPIFALILSLSLFYTIYKLITKHYKNKMRDRTILVQKEEIDANEKIIGELKEQNLALATTIHKYNHRLSALQNSIERVISSSNVEFANELSVLLEQTKTVGKQFIDETKVSEKLPTTNIKFIDSMLEYMRDEAVNSGIDFTLKLNSSIKPLLDSVISEDKFETLLGDHIKDAIIAIGSKEGGYKSILVLIGIVSGNYELSIYDTGIEFDIETLLLLGQEPITTHKDTGGSGLGFMTTFATLKSCKASLVIEEYDTSTTNYTKSVSISFDGKNEYRIYSYRADDIKSKVKGRKIIVNKI